MKIVTLGYSGQWMSRGALGRLKSCTTYFGVGGLAGIESSKRLTISGGKFPILSCILTVVVDLIAFCHDISDKHR
jgi:hypothetical protein